MRRLLVTALILAGCSGESGKQFLRPAVEKEKVVDSDMIAFDPKADVLFVIDNSASMGVHQTNLVQNIGGFTSVFLRKSVLNYGIATISTDTAAFYGLTRVVTNKTPNANRVLERNMLVGTNGYGVEMVFDSVVKALSPPLIDSQNAGFLRDDAALIVMMITDAEDQSRANTNPQDFYEFLVGLKHGDKSKVLSYGAIVPTNSNGSCERDETSVMPLRIEQFLALTDPTRANVLELCQTDFGARLAEFANDIVKRTSSTIPLSRVPKLESIRVTYGAMELPRDFDVGWSFDPAANVIHLGAQIDWSAQPLGSRVQVYYDVVKERVTSP